MNKTVILTSALLLVSAPALAADLDESTIQPLADNVPPISLELPEAASDTARGAASFGLETAHAARQLGGEGAREAVEAFRAQVREGAHQRGAH